MYCQHPVIIRNPQLRRLLIAFRAYCVRGRVHFLSESEIYWLKYSDKALGNYSPSRLGVTADNIHDFVVYSPSTGECVDMFLLVACGKCVLCRDKKSREWAFRAACENWASKSLPLFVTLTCDNAHLSPRGVDKRVIQLFLKRLRISLFRLLGYTCEDLRYFACGEYGRNTHRAHYHLILWNFPVDFHYFPNLHSKLEFIEKNWQQGFCMCLPVIKGGVNYVMKYMRKECEVPFGCNPVFFLSSRRHGGIGSAYANYMRSWVLDHPDAVEFKVYDRYQDVELTSCLPSYFRNLILPCNSKLVPKPIRDAYDEFGRRIVARNQYIRKIAKIDKICIDSNEHEVFMKFKFLGVYLTNENVHLVDTLNPVDVRFSSDYYDNEQRIVELVDILLGYKMDSIYVAEIIEKRKLHADAVFLFYKDSPERDLDYVASQLSRNSALSKEREKF